MGKRISDKLRELLVRMADENWKPNGLTFGMFIMGGQDTDILVCRGLVEYHNGKRGTSARGHKDGSITLSAGKDYYEITDKGRRAAAQFRKSVAAAKGEKKKRRKAKSA